MTQGERAQVEFRAVKAQVDRVAEEHRKGEKKGIEFEAAYFSVRQHLRWLEECLGQAVADAH